MHLKIYLGIIVSFILTFSFNTCYAEEVPSDLPKNYVVNDGGKIKHKKEIMFSFSYIFNT